MRATEVLGDVSLKQVIQRQDPFRSSGLHLSDILQHLNRTLEPAKFKDDIEENPEFAVLGLAFEECLAHALSLMVPGWEKPGEFSAEGIAMSPDGFGDPEFDGVDEFKATWKSMPDEAQDFCDHPKFAHYHRQAKSYCRVLGVRKVRFRVLFLCGNYRPSLPVFKTYVVKYTALELEENWQLVLSHGRDMGVL